MYNKHKSCKLKRFLTIKDTLYYQRGVIDILFMVSFSVELFIYCFTSSL